MLRRDFIRTSFSLGAGSLLLGNSTKLLSFPTAKPDAVWVQGGEPTELLTRALEKYGGMGNFISKGDVVVVKPNMGWDRAPEFAANTNPILVADVAKKCIEAGAKKVKIFDRTCNNPNRCYKNSKIEELSKKAGADVEQIRKIKFKDISLPNGEILKKWAVYKDYLDADKVINIPIAKHHSLCRITLGLKNLMGVMGGNRGNIHNHFSKKLIDIDAEILPTLTIIDAYRVLTRNGPSGGNLNDVKFTKTLIMSPCNVTADILALELFDLKVQHVPHIQEAITRGLNKYDPNQLSVERININ
jgi:uncharacterized protein (DUF362 family)